MIYPELPQWYLLGDSCDTPEYRGRIGTMPQFCVPAGYTLQPDEPAHEAGHLWFDLVSEKHPDAGDRYWKFRGFPGTWDEALAASQSKTGNEAWQLDPRESWAECFARSVVTTHSEKTQNWGMDVDPNAARLFFQSSRTSVTTSTYRHMYDSIYPSNIPADAQVVAGYVDGTYAWSDQDWAKFAGKTLVRICVWNNTFDADVIDIEGGNNDAKGAVPWVKGKWDRGETPTVYCYSDAGPEGYRVSDVRAECDAAGVKRPLIWITRAGDGSSFDPTGDTEIVALQYEFDGAYDVSVIANDWPKGQTTTNTTDGGVTYVTKADFDQFVADTNNTIAAIKARLAIDAHHTHSTSEPIEPAQ